MKNPSGSPGRAGSSAQPAPPGTSRCGTKNSPASSSRNVPGCSFSYMTFGCVPAAMRTVRAGISTVSPVPRHFPPSADCRSKRTAATAPSGPGTYSVGLRHSEKPIPSSSALTTSSWFSR